METQRPWIVSYRNGADWRHAEFKHEVDANSYSRWCWSQGYDDVRKETRRQWEYRQELNKSASDIWERALYRALDHLNA